MNPPLSLIFEKAQENLPGLLLYSPLSFLYRGIRIFWKNESMRN
ncbi:hypothetical protein FH5_04902 [Priestia endophytica]|nr:hypothetical protein FH5_04902 [Priestia endophytica]